MAPTRGPKGRTLRQESHEAVTWRPPPHGQLEGERDSQREGGQLGRPGLKAVEKIRVGQRRGYQHGARERQGSEEKWASQTVHYSDSGLVSGEDS